MSRKSNLNHQLLDGLKKNIKFGEKKHEEKQKNKEIAKQNHEKYKQVRGIYSYKTYKDYTKSVKSFTNYVTSTHTEVKNKEQAMAYVPEYINFLRDRGLSEWTVHAYIYALRSAYDCEVADLGVELKTRSRADVIRCRDSENNPYRNDERYEDTVKFLKATGARRQEFLRFRREDFREQKDKAGNRTGQLEVFKRGKNGIERWCLVNPAYTDYVRAYVAAKETIDVAGEARLFEKRDIPAKLPVHDLRSDYACDLYRFYEREGFASGNLYRCKGELSGITYDKGILEKVSYDLQHSRSNIVIEYLFKMR